VSEKMSCPGCGTHTSDVLRAFQEGQACPNCGLSASAADEVLAVRRAQADERVKAAGEQALVRAGRAESANRVLRYRLDRIKEEVGLALASDLEVPDWWEPG